MTQHTMFVCVLCQFSNSDQAQAELSAGQVLFNQLSAGLEQSDLHDTMQLQPVRCMGACDRSCVAAFAAPQKLTFILNELSPTQSVPELLQFCHQYIEATDGRVPYKERPEAIKKGIHAVLPPLPAASSVAVES